jgi:hypothetical protein
VNPTPRPAQAPRVVKTCWALALLIGAALVIVRPHPARPEPNALSPYSLASYLRRVAGPDAHQIRVNGFYGSGHQGAWQFVAHLTWRTSDGQIAGGTTMLPLLAGQPTLKSSLRRARLDTEEHIGWTLKELDAVLDKASEVDAPLALAELEIPSDGAGKATTCHAHLGSPASCEARDSRARRSNLFQDQLTDQPFLDALSVQRASEPISP